MDQTYTASLQQTSKEWKGLQRLPQEILDEIISQTDFHTAIKLGNKYAITRLYDGRIHTWNVAAEEGHLDLIKWLHDSPFTGRTEECTTKAMDWAASKGHLPIVKFLHENRTEGCTTSAMDGAAMNGHFSIVKFLQEKIIDRST